MKTEQIGDGKMPNKYWVFQYDQKYKRTKLEDGSTLLEIIQEDDNTSDDRFLGVFPTYKEALVAANNAYLPNVIIEDRLSGQVFEQICVVCQDCGDEKWQTSEDIGFTRETMTKRGLTFA